MRPDESCPRCGRTPCRVESFGRPDKHIPSCVCYPHPPLCIGCCTPLDGDKCPQLECRFYDLRQPEPITDPLWERP